MNIIFCNITYLKYYDGRVAGEMKPKTGGRWVQENEDAHEKWNFLNVDGRCFGYVQQTGEEFHIEKFEKKYRHCNSTNNVLVIWCATHPDRGTVIVGWYENATASRLRRHTRCTPISGLDRDYWFDCKAEDAYLLPEEKRTFTIGRASKDGKGKGFGQSNTWFAESEYAREYIIPNVLEFINAHKEYRINALTHEFLDTGNSEPLTKKEKEYVDSLTDDQFLEYLPFAYRMYANDPSADNAYGIATSLNYCYQYSLALPWYEKTVEIDPEDLQTKGTLAYIYQQLEMFEKSTEIVDELLKVISEEDTDLRDELYCIMADNSYFEDKMEEAITWLERILQESKNKELLSHIATTMAEWKKLLD